MIKKSNRLGDLLLDNGLITTEQLNFALQRQKATGKKLGEILIDESIIQEKQIIEVLEFQLGIPHMDLGKYYIDPEIPQLINENLARRHMLIPIRREHDKLFVAMNDPLNIFARDDMQIATGLEVFPVIASRNDILNAIDQYYGKQRAEQAIEEFKKQYHVDSIGDIAEKRLPQDGRVEAVIDGRDVDLRISVMPTVYGEKIVIRLLDRSSFVTSKSQLGFIPESMQLFDRILKNPNGIILKSMTGISMIILNAGHGNQHIQAFTRTGLQVSMM